MRNLRTALSLALVTAIRTPCSAQAPDPTADALIHDMHARYGTLVNYSTEVHTELVDTRSGKVVSQFDGEAYNRGSLHRSTLAGRTSILGRSHFVSVDEGSRTIYVESRGSGYARASAAMDGVSAFDSLLANARGRVFLVAKDKSSYTLEYHHAATEPYSTTTIKVRRSDLMPMEMKYSLRDRESANGADLVRITYTKFNGSKAPDSRYFDTDGIVRDKGKGQFELAPEYQGYQLIQSGGS